MPGTQSDSKTEAKECDVSFDVELLEELGKYNHDPEAIREIISDLCKDLAMVYVRALPGGCSGAILVSAYKAFRHDGNQAAPFVVKVDKSASIREEVAKGKLLEKYLGNNFPGFILQTRKNIAEDQPMGVRFEFIGATFDPELAGGKIANSTFKEVYDNQVLNMVDAEDSTENGDTIFSNPRMVIGEVFGMLLFPAALPRRNARSSYVKDGLEKCDLLSEYRVLEYIERHILNYRQKYKQHQMAPAYVRQILKTEKWSSLLRYARAMREYATASSSSVCRDAYKGIVHGDLNGNNIMLDCYGTSFLIDFAFTAENTHNLKDLTKLESSIILEYTRVENDADMDALLLIIYFMAYYPGVCVPETPLSTVMTTLFNYPHLPCSCSCGMTYAEKYGNYEGLLVQMTKLGKASMELTWDCVVLLRKYMGQYSPGLDNPVNVNIPLLGYSLKALKYTEFMPEDAHKGFSISSRDQTAARKITVLLHTIDSYLRSSLSLLKRAGKQPNPSDGISASGRAIDPLVYAEIQRVPKSDLLESREREIGYLTSAHFRDIIASHMNVLDVATGARVNVVQDCIARRLRLISKADLESPTSLEALAGSPLDEDESLSVDENSLFSLLPGARFKTDLGPHFCANPTMSQQQSFVVLGAPGIGTSTLLKRLVAMAARQYQQDVSHLEIRCRSTESEGIDQNQDEEERKAREGERALWDYNRRVLVPVYIPIPQLLRVSPLARGMEQDCYEDPIDAYISAYYGTNSTRVGLLKRALQDQRLVLLVDGIHCAPDNVRVKILESVISGPWATRVIITCQSNLFPVLSFSISQGNAAPERSWKYAVLPTLSPGQAASILMRRQLKSKYCDEAIIADKMPTLSNPVVLLFFAAYDDRDGNDSGLTDGVVLEKVSSLLLRRNRDVALLPETRIDELVTAVRKLAYWIHMKCPARTLSVRVMVATRDNNHTAATTKVSPNDCTTRLDQKTFEDLASSGILNFYKEDGNSESAISIYRCQFSYFVMQQLFAAKYICQEIQKTSKTVEISKTFSYYFQHLFGDGSGTIFDPWYREILLYVTDLLDEASYVVCCQKLTEYVPRYKALSSLLMGILTRNNSNEKKKARNEAIRATLRGVINEESTALSLVHPHSVIRKGALVEFEALGVTKERTMLCVFASSFNIRVDLRANLLPTKCVKMAKNFSKERPAWATRGVLEGIQLIGCVQSKDLMELVRSFLLGCLPDNFRSGKRSPGMGIHHAYFRQIISAMCRFGYVLSRPFLTFIFAHLESSKKEDVRLAWKALQIWADMLQDDSIPRALSSEDDDDMNSDEAVTELFNTFRQMNIIEGASHHYLIKIVAALLRVNPRSVFEELQRCLHSVEDSPIRSSSPIRRVPEVQKYFEKPSVSADLFLSICEVLCNPGFSASTEINPSYLDNVNNILEDALMNAMEMGTMKITSDPNNFASRLLKIQGAIAKLLNSPRGVVHGFFILGVMLESDKLAKVPMNIVKGPALADPSSLARTMISQSHVGDATESCRIEIRLRLTFYREFMEKLSFNLIGSPYDEPTYLGLLRLVLVLYETKRASEPDMYQSLLVDVFEYPLGLLFVCIQRYFSPTILATLQECDPRTCSTIITQMFQRFKTPDSIPKTFREMVYRRAMRDNHKELETLFSDRNLGNPRFLQGSERNNNLSFSGTAIPYRMYRLDVCESTKPFESGTMTIPAIITVVLGLWGEDIRLANQIQDFVELADILESCGVIIMQFLNDIGPCGLQVFKNIGTFVEDYDWSNETIASMSMKISKHVLNMNFVDENRNDEEHMDDNEVIEVMSLDEHAVQSDSPSGGEAVVFEQQPSNDSVQKSEPQGSAVKAIHDNQDFQNWLGDASAPLDSSNHVASSSPDVYSASLGLQSSSYKTKRSSTTPAIYAEAKTAPELLKVQRSSISGLSPAASFRQPHSSSFRMSHTSDRGILSEVLSATNPEAEGSSEEVDALAFNSETIGASAKYESSEITAEALEIMLGNPPKRGPEKSTMSYIDLTDDEAKFADMFDNIFMAIQQGTPMCSCCEGKPESENCTSRIYHLLDALYDKLCRPGGAVSSFTTSQYVWACERISSSMEDAVTDICSSICDFPSCFPQIHLGQLQALANLTNLSDSSGPALPVICLYSLFNGMNANIEDARYQGLSEPLKSIQATLSSKTSEGTSTWGCPRDISFEDLISSIEKYAPLSLDKQTEVAKDLFHLGHNSRARLSGLMENISLYTKSPWWNREQFGTAVCFSGICVEASKEEDRIFSLDTMLCSTLKTCSVFEPQKSEAIRIARSRISPKYIPPALRKFIDYSQTSVDMASLWTKQVLKDSTSIVSNVQFHEQVILNIQDVFGNDKAQASGDDLLKLTSYLSGLASNLGQLNVQGCMERAYFTLSRTDDPTENLLKFDTYRTRVCDHEYELMSSRRVNAMSTLVILAATLARQCSDTRQLIPAVSILIGLIPDPILTRQILQMGDFEVVRSLREYCSWDATMAARKSFHNSKCCCIELIVMEHWIFPYTCTSNSAALDYGCDLLLYFSESHRSGSTKSSNGKSPLDTVEPAAMHLFNQMIAACSPSIKDETITMLFIKIRRLVIRLLSRSYDNDNISDEVVHSFLLLARNTIKTKRIEPAIEVGTLLVDLLYCVATGKTLPTSGTTELTAEDFEKILRGGITMPYIPKVLMTALEDAVRGLVDVFYLFVRDPSKPCKAFVGKFKVVMKVAQIILNSCSSIVDCHSLLKEVGSALLYQSVYLEWHDCDDIPKIGSSDDEIETLVEWLASKLQSSDISIVQRALNTFSSHPGLFDVAEFSISLISELGNAWKNALENARLPPDILVQFVELLRSYMIFPIESDEGSIRSVEDSGSIDIVRLVQDKYLHSKVRIAVTRKLFALVRAEILSDSARIDFDDVVRFCIDIIVSSASGNISFVMLELLRGLFEEYGEAWRKTDSSIERSFNIIVAASSLTVYKKPPAAHTRSSSVEDIDTIEQEIAECSIIRLVGNIFLSCAVDMDILSYLTSVRDLLFRLDLSNIVARSLCLSVLSNVVQVVHKCKKRNLIHHDSPEAEIFDSLVSKDSLLILTETCGANALSALRGFSNMRSNRDKSFSDIIVERTGHFMPQGPHQLFNDNVFLFDTVFDVVLDPVNVINQYSRQSPMDAWYISAVLGDVPSSRYAKTNMTHLAFIFLTHLAENGKMHWRHWVQFKNQVVGLCVKVTVRALQQKREGEDLIHGKDKQIEASTTVYLFSVAWMLDPCANVSPIINSHENDPIASVLKLLRTDDDFVFRIGTHLLECPNHPDFTCGVRCKAIHTFISRLYSTVELYLNPRATRINITRWKESCKILLALGRITTVLWEKTLRLFLRVVGVHRSYDDTFLKKAILGMIRWYISEPKGGGRFGFSIPKDMIPSMLTHLESISTAAWSETYRTYGVDIVKLMMVKGVNPRAIRYWHVANTAVQMYKSSSLQTRRSSAGIMDSLVDHFSKVYQQSLPHIHNDIESDVLNLLEATCSLIAGEDAATRGMGHSRSPSGKSKFYSVCIDETLLIDSSFWKSGKIIEDLYLLCHPEEKSNKLGDTRKISFRKFLVTFSSCVFNLVLVLYPLSSTVDPEFVSKAAGMGEIITEDTISCVGDVVSAMQSFMRRLPGSSSSGHGTTFKSYSEGLSQLTFTLYSEVVLMKRPPHILDAHDENGLVYSVMLMRKLHLHLPCHFVSSDDGLFRLKGLMECFIDSLKSIHFREVTLRLRHLFFGMQEEYEKDFGLTRLPCFFSAPAFFYQGAHHLRKKDVYRYSGYMTIGKKFRDVVKLLQTIGPDSTIPAKAFEFVLECLLSQTIIGPPWGSLGIPLCYLPDDFGRTMKCAAEVDQQFILSAYCFEPGVPSPYTLSEMTLLVKDCLRSIFSDDCSVEEIKPGHAYVSSLHLIFMTLEALVCGKYSSEKSIRLFFDIMHPFFTFIVASQKRMAMYTKIESLWREDNDGEFMNPYKQFLLRTIFDVSSPNVNIYSEKLEDIMFALMTCSPIACEIVALMIPRLNGLASKKMWSLYQRFLSIYPNSVMAETMASYIRSCSSELFSVEKLLSAMYVLPLEKWALVQQQTLLGFGSDTLDPGEVVAYESTIAHLQKTSSEFSVEINHVLKSLQARNVGQHGPKTPRARILRDRDQPQGLPINYYLMPSILFPFHEACADNANAVTLSYLVTLGDGAGYEGEIHKTQTSKNRKVVNSHDFMDAKPLYYAIEAYQKSGKSSAFDFLMENCTTRLQKTMGGWNALEVLCRRAGCNVGMMIGKFYSSKVVSSLSSDNLRKLVAPGLEYALDTWTSCLQHAKSLIGWSSVCFTADKDRNNVFWVTIDPESAFSINGATDQLVIANVERINDKLRTAQALLYALTNPPDDARMASSLKLDVIFPSKSSKVSSSSGLPQRIDRVLDLQKANIHHLIEDDRLHIFSALEQYFSEGLLWEAVFDEAFKFYGGNDFIRQNIFHEMAFNESIESIRFLKEHCSAALSKLSNRLEDSVEAQKFLKDASGNTPLHLACKQGSIKMVMELVTLLPQSISIMNNNYQIPARVFRFSKHRNDVSSTEVFQVLLQEGTVADFVSVLSNCAAFGSADALDSILLLAEDLSQSLQVEDLVHPLKSCVIYRNSECLRKLLLRFRGKAIQSPDLLSIMQIFDWPTIPQDLFTSFLAVLSDSCGAVAPLGLQGNRQFWMEINQSMMPLVISNPYFSTSPLYCDAVLGMMEVACTKGYRLLAATILDEAPKNLPFTDVINVAAESRIVKFIKIKREYMVQKGRRSSQVHAVKMENRSPAVSLLSLAASQGHQNILQLFCLLGVSVDWIPDIKDDEVIYSPLFHACSSGVLDTVRELVHRGANISAVPTTARDFECYLPIPHFCLRPYGLDEVSTDVIESASSSQTFSTNDILANISPLLAAICGPSPDCAKYILSQFKSQSKKTRSQSGSRAMRQGSVASVYSDGPDSRQKVHFTTTEDTGEIDSLKCGFALIVSLLRGWEWRGVALHLSRLISDRELAFVCSLPDSTAEVMTSWRIFRTVTNDINPILDAVFNRGGYLRGKPASNRIEGKVARLLMFHAIHAGLSSLVVRIASICSLGPGLWQRLVMYGKSTASRLCCSDISIALNSLVIDQIQICYEGLQPMIALICQELSESHVVKIINDIAAIDTNVEDISAALENMLGPKPLMRINRIQAQIDEKQNAQADSYKKHETITPMKLVHWCKHVALWNRGRDSSIRLFIEKTKTTSTFSGKMGLHQRRHIMLDPMYWEKSVAKLLVSVYQKIKNLKSTPQQYPWFSMSEMHTILRAVSGRPRQVDLVSNKRSRKRIKYTDIVKLLRDSQAADVVNANRFVVSPLEHLIFSRLVERGSDTLSNMKSLSKYSVALQKAQAETNSLPLTGESSLGYLHSSASNYNDDLALTVSVVREPRSLKLFENTLTVTGKSSDVAKSKISKHISKWSHIRRAVPAIFKFDEKTKQQTTIVTDFFHKVGSAGLRMLQASSCQWIDLKNDEINIIELDRVIDLFDNSPNLQHKNMLGWIESFFKGSKSRGDVIDSPGQYFLSLMRYSAAAQKDSSLAFVSTFGLLDSFPNYFSKYVSEICSDVSTSPTWTLPPVIKYSSRSLSVSSWTTIETIIKGFPTLVAGTKLTQGGKDVDLRMADIITHPDIHGVSLFLISCLPDNYTLFRFLYDWMESDDRMVRMSEIVHRTSRHGFGPMHMACATGNISAAKALLHYCKSFVDVVADLSRDTTWSRFTPFDHLFGSSAPVMCHTPMFYACRSGQQEVVKDFVNAGAKISSTPSTRLPMENYCRIPHLKLRRNGLDALSVNELDQASEDSVFTFRDILSNINPVLAAVCGPSPESARYLMGHLRRDTGGYSDLSIGIAVFIALSRGWEWRGVATHLSRLVNDRQLAFVCSLPDSFISPRMGNLQNWVVALSELLENIYNEGGLCREYRNLENDQKPPTNEITGRVAVTFVSLSVNSGLSELTRRIVNACEGGFKLWQRVLSYAFKSASTTCSNEIGFLLNMTLIPLLYKWRSSVGPAIQAVYKSFLDKDEESFKAIPGSKDRYPWFNVSEVWLVITAMANARGFDFAAPKSRIGSQREKIRFTLEDAEKEISKLSISLEQMDGASNLVMWTHNAILESRPLWNTLTISKPLEQVCGMYNRRHFVTFENEDDHLEISDPYLGDCGSPIWLRNQVPYDMNEFCSAMNAPHGSEYMTAISRKQPFMQYNTGQAVAEDFARIWAEFKWICHDRRRRVYANISTTEVIESPILTYILKLGSPGLRMLFETVHKWIDYKSGKLIVNEFRSVVEAFEPSLSREGVKLFSGIDNANPHQHLTASRSQSLMVMACMTHACRIKKFKAGSLVRSSTATIIDLDPGLLLADLVCNPESERNARSSDVGIIMRDLGMVGHRQPSLITQHHFIPGELVRLASSGYMSSLSLDDELVSHNMLHWIASTAQIFEGTDSITKNDVFQMIEKSCAAAGFSLSSMLLNFRDCGGLSYFMHLITYKFTVAVEWMTSAHFKELMNGMDRFNSNAAFSLACVMANEPAMRAIISMKNFTIWPVRSKKDLVSLSSEISGIFNFPGIIAAVAAGYLDHETVIRAVKTRPVLGMDLANAIADDTLDEPLRMAFYVTLLSLIEWGLVSGRQRTTFLKTMYELKLQVLLLSDAEWNPLRAVDYSEPPISAFDNYREVLQKSAAAYLKARAQVDFGVQQGVVDGNAESTFGQENMAEFGRTLIFGLMKSERWEEFDFLLRCTATERLAVLARDENKQTVLHYFCNHACSVADVETIVSLFRKHDESAIRAVDKDQMTILHYITIFGASRGAPRDILNMLTQPEIEAMAMARDRFGRTPLALACSVGRVEILEVLQKCFNMKEILKVTEHRYRSCLLLAVEGRREPMCKYLLGMGLGPQSLLSGKDSKLEDCLRVSMMYGSETLAREINKKARPGAIRPLMNETSSDWNGGNDYSPFEYALAFGNVQVAEKLLSSNSPSLRDFSHDCLDKKGERFIEAAFFKRIIDRIVGICFSKDDRSFTQAHNLLSVTKIYESPDIVRATVLGSLSEECRPFIGVPASAFHAASASGNHRTLEILFQGLSPQDSRELASKDVSEGAGTHWPDHPERIVNPISLAVKSDAPERTVEILIEMHGRNADELKAGWLKSVLMSSEQHFFIDALASIILFGEAGQPLPFGTVLGAIHPSGSAGNISVKFSDDMTNPYNLLRLVELCCLHGKYKMVENLTKVLADPESIRNLASTKMAKKLKEGYFHYTALDAALGIGDMSTATVVLSWFDGREKTAQWIQTDIAFSVAGLPESYGPLYKRILANGRMSRDLFPDPTFFAENFDRMNGPSTFVVKWNLTNEDLGIEDTDDKPWEDNEISLKDEIVTKLWSRQLCEYPKQADLLLLRPEWSNDFIHYNRDDGDNLASILDMEPPSMTNSASQMTMSQSYGMSLASYGGVEPEGVPRPPGKNRRASVSRRDSFSVYVPNLSDDPVGILPGMTQPRRTRRSASRKQLAEAQAAHPLRSTEYRIVPYERRPSLSNLSEKHM